MKLYDVHGDGASESLDFMLDDIRISFHPLTNLGTDSSYNQSIIRGVLNLLQSEESPDIVLLNLATTNAMNSQTLLVCLFSISQN